MSRVSSTPYIKSRQDEIAQMVALYRVFRTPLRKLRSLPSPVLTRHWWRAKTLECHYRLHVLSMQETVRYLNKFALVVPLEEIKSEDDEEGTRTFTATLPRGEYTLNLILKAIPQTTDENPEAKCRKVVVGTDTHTYTSHRYAIVCD
jgi:hypothetical protein